MKLTKKQRIINYAKQNPNGFTPKQLLADTKIKDKNIWVTLSGMKKAGVLVHDPKTSTYRLADGQVKKAPMASWDGENAGKPITKQKLKDMLDLWNAEIAAEEESAFSKKIMGDYADMTGDLVNLAEKYERVVEQYTDALAIIRYLEGKLYTVIQRDARSQG